MFRKSLLFRAVPLLAFLALEKASPATWHVDGSVSASGDGKSWARAFETIQHGIDTANNGDTVTVAPGTYRENIGFGGKNIVLRSTDPLDPNVVAKTVIDGGMSGSVVTFSGTEDATCVLSGFTITHGGSFFGGGILGGGDQHTRATIQNNVIKANGGSLYDDSNFGGGIAYCDGLIENNVITGNSAEHFDGLFGDRGGAGGGLLECNGTIRGNVITGNRAGFDGGGLCWCNATIEGNIISGNSCSGSGGGLYGCDGVISNNLIAGNKAYGRTNMIVQDPGWELIPGMGGGLCGCKGTIQSNRIADNWAGSGGGGLSSCGGDFVNNTIVRNEGGAQGGRLSECNGMIRNSILWGNAAPEGAQLRASSLPAYSCIQDWDGSGFQNIDEEPLFLDEDGPDDKPESYEDNDYHLQEGSACIDAGADYYWSSWPQRDLDGNCRLAGDRVDIGCYEHASFVDSDGDILSDSDELTEGTDPHIEDSDEDGLRDGLEILRGSDPLQLTPPGVLRVPGDMPAVQGAVCVAMEGDEVIVSPGLYHESVRFCGADIVLRSSNPDDPDTVASTILDGAGGGPVVWFTGRETAACVLSGFTVRNGRAHRGGGISGGTRENHAHARILSNVVTANSAEFQGGGIAYCDGLIRGNRVAANLVTWQWGAGAGLYDCDGLIQNNFITHNSAPGELSSGGALCWCDGTIETSLILGNSASDGGGLYRCSGIVRNNLVVGNAASSGGGADSCYGILENNTIVGNSANYGGALHGGVSGTIRNCIIWGNIAEHSSQLHYSALPIHSCIQDWAEGGEGNIAEDPRFADADGPDDDPNTYEDNDYHLVAGSPSINAGKNEGWMWAAVDLDGNPRIWGGTVDMGAYEYGSFRFKIINAVFEGTAAVLSWNSRPGDTYYVWSSSGLPAGEWYEEGTVESGGKITTWLDPSSTVGRKFYRIELP